jgi:hypothetical protein
MKAKLPYSKPATSPYSIPPFYWRGGDTLREKEYISDEYRKAFSDYRRASLEHHQVQAELQRLNAILEERDGYTTALADYLDGDSEGYLQEIQLKTELTAVEKEILVYNEELKARLACHNPGVHAGLLKEKAYFLIEIERQMKALENTNAEIAGKKAALARISIGPRYNNGVNLEFLLAKYEQKHKHLRSLVSKTWGEFDRMPGVLPLQTAEARAQRPAMWRLLEVKMLQWRTEERWETRAKKRAGFLNLLIDRIEELNVRMKAIGLEGDVVETDSLRVRAMKAVGEEVPEAVKPPEKRRRRRKVVQPSEELPTEEKAEPAEEGEAIVLSDGEQEEGRASGRERELPEPGDDEPEVDQGGDASESEQA